MARISKLSEEDKRTIVTLCNTGAKATDVAEKYGISKGTVWNIVSEWKKHGENAFTDETINDTDEAEKEPATVGAVTSSEEEMSVENISEPIVPDIGENVKPVADIPEAVKEACWESIERLRADINDWKMSISLWEEKIKEMEDFIGKAGV